MEFIYPTTSSLKKKWRVTSVCTKCGDITSKWYTRKWTDLCGKCARGRRTTPEFIKAGIEMHGDSYTYEDTVYINNDTKLEVTCPIHGNWSVRPTDFLSGSNCPKCSKAVTAKTLENTIEEWQQQILNPKVKILSKESKDFGTFVCSDHGKFKARFQNVIKSPTSGCTICNRLVHTPQPKRDTLADTSCTLYWVYVGKVDMYKLGITTQNVEQRFSISDEISVLWTKELPYSEAIAIEHNIHTKFTTHRYKGSLPLLKDGTYELYHNNIFKTYEDTL